MNNLTAQIAEKSAEFASESLRSAANAKDALVDAWETIQDKAPIQAASNCLRDHSAEAVLVALGCGVLLGLYLNRPEPSSLMERCKQTGRNLGI